MKSGCSYWLRSVSASVGVFLGQRLSALGEIIAYELERLYAGLPNHDTLEGRSSRNYRKVAVANQQASQKLVEDEER